MSRAVSLGFLRNTVRERIIRYLTGAWLGYRRLATENPVRDDATVLSSSPQRVFALEGAVIDTITNYVYDRELRLISESTSWNLDRAVARFPARPRAPREVTIAGEVIHLGTDAYYHWLIEEVPAYLQARAARPEARTIVRKSAPAYVRDLLGLLGVTATESTLYARVGTLVFAARGIAAEPNAVDLASLHELRDSLELPLAGRKKIYISRRDSGRFPRNESAVEAIAAAAGCDIVRLTGMPLLDQIALFAGAELVVATHGAGLANLAWCRDGATSVVEIAQRGQPDCFERLAALSSLPYTRVDAPDGPDWTVDLDALAEALRRD